MGAFLENSLFFFVDDAEPILPIFRSPEYDDPGRIVEVTDVGCDTETTYPLSHFSRGAFHRRRGGAESYESRRVAEWRNERPSKFPRTITTILNNNKDRNGNYIGRSRFSRTNRDYDNMYIAEPDYDSYEENSYDFELSKDDSATEYKDDYSTRFVNPRNIVGQPNRKKLSRDGRYNYTRDLESPFTRSSRLRQKEKTSARQWFTESDERNFGQEDADIRSRQSLLNERKKRTKIISRTDENFNCKMEFGKGMAKRRERDDFPDVIDSKDIWDSVSLENNASYEELTFTDPKLKTHGGLQPKMSYNFVNSEREEESEETQQEDNRENLSSKISTRSTKYQTSKNDAIKEKPKILQSNTLNANSLRIKSAKTPIDERTSNMNFAGKNSISTRPRSAVEGKKVDVNSTSERRTETRNMTFARTNVNDRVNKLSNETHQPTRTLKRTVDSISNKHIYTTNKEDDTNRHSKNPRNNKIDRTNVAISRPTTEKKNEKNILKMTDTLSSTKVEREKRKFFSRLPIRTWKRLRTREPAALRLEMSDITNENDNQKLQTVDNVTTSSNDHLEKIKSDEVREEIRTAHATADIKRSNHFRVGLLSADKSKITSSNVKNIKGLKDLSTTKRTSEQQKKKISIK